MMTISRDLRDAWRALRARPGWTAVAVATLALGIGATTTIFTVVNGVLLRPLAYADPGRLVMIWNDFGVGAQSLPAVSPGDFRDYQLRSKTFEAFAAASGAGVASLRGNLTGDGEPERVDLTTVTANFFPLLGVKPMLGRTFTPEEEVAGGAHVVVLSHRLWLRRYGGDPGLVGRTIEVDGVAHEVVGILPPGFRLDLPSERFLVTDAEVFAPIQFDYKQAPPRNYTFFTVFGRIKRDATLAQAQAEMDGIAAQFRTEFPEHAASQVRIRVVPLQDDVVKHARPALVLLLGAVGLVLLIACANVANLLLARGAARRSEFALRAALGAGRRALLRQVLTESLLLALTGGGLGLGLAVLALETLRALHPANLPRLGDVQLDGTVVLFTFVTCSVTAVIFGLLPAARAAGADPQESLQGSGRGSAGDRRRVRDLLIVAEVALAVVLLVSAGLLIRSFLALQHVQPGFDAHDVLTFQVALPAQTYPGAPERVVWLTELERRLDALPGVRSAGIISQLPLSGSGSLSPFAYDEKTAREWESVTADGRNVSPGYFRTMNARIVAGRDFTADDDADAPPVAIVDESLARQAWPGQSAVGKQLQVQPTGSPNMYVEVVGVVAHLRAHDLTREVRPQLYRPIGQLTWFQADVVVEAAGDPAALGPEVTREVRAMDKTIALRRMTPLASYVDDAMAQSRFSLLLMAALGGIALVLAAVGIYGVIAYSVSQRTREFGIRLALGEEPGHTRRSVVLGGMRLVGVSMALGLTAALALARLLRGQLYQVAPGDPLTFTGIAALLALVALLACYIPARRATRVDPALALRSE
jgi:putative ABC transport system permease protein